MKKIKQGEDKREKTDDVFSLLATPAGFATGILRATLYPWQEEVMNWFANTGGRVKGSCAAPNGSGKSERITACLALWWLCMAPKARVVITSKDSRQLDEQLWPALESYKSKFLEFVFKYRCIESPTGGKILGFTTDEPGRAEGWHKQEDGPLLLIADEAKSISDEIFTAFDRCTFNGLLYISSAGLMQGRFFESQTSKADQYLTKKVSLDECPHIPKERIEDIISSYGSEHPFTRSTLFSEFMNQDEGSAFFFSLSEIEKAISSPPPYRAGDRVAFCDFAGGGDENVLAIREGNRVRIEHAWRESNEMAAIGEFISLFRKNSLKPEEIYGDNAGAGKPMIARFEEVGWPINRFNAGESAHDDRDFFNRGAEVWETASREISKRSSIIPDDPMLKAQLSSRKRTMDSRGRIKCETKDDMRKRGIKSPDRADAVTACLSLREAKTRNSKQEINPPWMDTFSDNFQASSLVGCEMGD